MSQSGEQFTHSVCEMELIEIIGVEDTLRLERAFGASYLYIPAREPSPKIIDAIGIHAGRKLVDYFGQSEIWVPKVLLLKRRNQEIADRNRAGETTPQIASRFGLSISTIKRVLKTSREQ
ncbi:MAG: hypothetical protein OIF34_04930 [Porticoccaceae bacterium]|nr:hypothetical protein [Porticoccaceae bacterium]